jgi:hypothetical protein
VSDTKTWCIPGLTSDDIDRIAVSLREDAMHRSRFAHSLQVNAAYSKEFIDECKASAGRFNTQTEELVRHILVSAQQET